jgi:DNA-binding LacI/PurR family transcriptional regulator
MVGSYLFRHQLKKVLKDQRCVHIDPADQSLLPSVSFDRSQAIQLAVNHLYELGHRHFGTFGFSRNNNAARWQGIVESLSVRGIDPERNVQVFVLDDLGSESYGEGIRLVELFLSAKKRPTALIAVNDRVAFGAIQGFRDAGVRIPEDVSMVGFGNLSMSRYLRPTLTTIDLQPQLLIQKAGNLLLKQLRESGPPEEESRLSVEPLLIVRESTGPAQRRP